MKIVYGRTAYVLGCGQEIMDNVLDKFNTFADGGENVCVNRDMLNVWLEEHREDCDIRTDTVTKEDEMFAAFIKNVDSKINGDVGDIIFSK